VLRLQAVSGGKWLLVEDIDTAPPEVLAALAPLLESRSLHLSHRAQLIPAASGFQFLATVTSSPGEAALARDDGMSAERPAAGCCQPGITAGRQSAALLLPLAAW